MLRDIRAFEDGIVQVLRLRADAADGRPDQEEALDDDLRNRLHAALKEYKANFVAELQAAKA